LLRQYMLQRFKEKHSSKYMIKFLNIEGVYFVIRYSV
jgi:hypothetical protein